MKLNFNTMSQAVRRFYQSNLQTPQGPGLMRNRIVLSLSASEPGRVDWLRLDSQGVRLQTVTGGELAQLAATEDDAITVMVPAQEILLTQTALPKLSAYRLQQALPFALEEQVLDELDLLHFAAGPYQSILAGEENPSLPVAIVKKALMEQWLELLRQQGIQPEVLTPAIFALPHHENQWQLLLTRDAATVRTGLYSGFSTEPQNLETLLALKWGETGNKPEKLVIYHDQGLDCALPALTLPIERIGLGKAQKLELAAAALESLPPLNLLQAPYAPTRKLRVPERNKKAWQLAALAFSLWLGLGFVGKLGALMILGYEHHHLKNLITETYRAQFPQTRTVIEPQSRMAGKLKKALAQSEKSRLFQWLGYLAKSAAAVRIQSFNFQNNQLSLEVIAPSFSSLDELMLSLKGDGLEVKQQAAAMAGNQVKAVLVIEGKST